MGSINHAIGKRIKYLRKEKGLSQEELGNAMGLTQNNISKMENGDVSLTIENLLLLSSFFNVTTDYICTGQKNDNILHLLERYANIEYHSLNCGIEHYDYPVLRINHIYFEYLIRIAQAKSDKRLPDDIKELWKSKEVTFFNQSRQSDNFCDYIETVPVPLPFFYPDDNKSSWEQSDLIREVDKYYINSKYK